MKGLQSTSITLIKQYQHESGAYVASPNFPVYRYSWLRDGSFIGYAMLREGERDSCSRFLTWVDGAVSSQRERVERVLRERRSGKAPEPQDLLPTRYNLDGSLSADSWPNFQIDGYGAWLWLLAEYVRRTGEETLLLRFHESIRLTLDYLEAVWNLPVFDCWEEFGDYLHPSTLACVYGGINSINELLGEKHLTTLTGTIRETILGFTADGRFRKNSVRSEVDASLLWLALPFEVVPPQDERMRRTVRLIEEELYEGGGVKRYPGDTYYGGGLWILLACWLGWYYVRTNATGKAEAILEWVESKADAEGSLPEQVAGRTTDENHRKEWEQRWGAVARPLLWSHAMYLVLRRELAES